MPDGLFPPPLMGMGGPMGGPPGAGPGSPPAMMASPETVSPAPGPEAQTLVASPLADRIGGALTAQQQLSSMKQVSELLRMGLQLLARQLKDINPRGAAQLEKMAAQLLTMIPAPNVPMTPGGVRGLAQGLPPVGPGMAMPPPPATPVGPFGGVGPGVGPLSGPFPGM